MNNISTYSPEDVIVLIAGLVRVTGFVSNTFISIEKDIPAYSTRESADGVVSRVHRPSNTFTTRLILANTSPSNDVLTIIAKADELTQMAKFPMIIKDTRGSSILFAQTCWIEGIPDSDFDSSITSRSWVIKCADAQMHVGGNDNASEFIEDLFNSAGTGTLQNTYQSGNF